MQEGESEILSPSRHNPLIVVSLEGELIKQVPAPARGWTHTALVQQAERLTSATKSGANAYLGTSWVGSTEI